MSRDRTEHLAWCKEQALEYLDRGDVKNAITSMLSDMNKHPETRLPNGSPMIAMGMLAIMTNDVDEAHRFIVGFN